MEIKLFVLVLVICLVVFVIVPILVPMFSFVLQSTDTVNACLSGVCP
jgi:hypothetical protein